LMCGNPTEGPRQCLGRQTSVKSMAQVFRQQTILQKNIEALLHEEIGIEDDQPEGERKDVITCSDLEKAADRIL